MASLSCIPKFVKDEITTAWKNESLKLMLLKNTFTPNAATHQYVSNLDTATYEIAATTGYAAGGVAIAGNASTAHGNNYFLDATDQVIGPGASLNYRYLVVYADTGNPATSKIRAIIDLETDQIVSNGTSTITWNALGIIYVS